MKALGAFKERLVGKQPVIAVAEPPRKSEEATVIAHISDLHFRADTDSASNEWLALSEDLSNHQVDLLVVTGDIIDASIEDSFFNHEGIRRALDNAYEYLTETLCHNLSLDPNQSMLVVPGNHDCRIKGVIWKKAHSKLFRVRFGEHFKHVLFPTLHLCVFVFDSNNIDRGVNLAMGLVKEDDLVRFSALTKRIAESVDLSEAWHSSTRVALLHHHPMPIAATEHRAGVRSREEFLLLRNAGLFMTEMVDRQIDLVLHGHRHYPAFSKATFPIESEREHTVTVVSAGSAGPGAEKYHRSYNLITIADNGRISLERKVLETANYKGYHFTLQTYEGARQSKFARIAQKAKAQMSVRKISRVDRIKSGSGDVDISELFESVTAYGEDVSEVESTLFSKTGFFCRPNCVSLTPNQKVAFVWRDIPNETGQEEGFIKFEPPLSKTPISFQRTRKILNGIHFSERDRYDATDHASSEESVYLIIKNVYDLFTLRVVFPKAHFPSDFRFEAIDSSGRLDGLERAHAFSRFFPFPEDSAIMLVLEKPLPGYKYRVVWDLPLDDPADSGINSKVASLASEVAKRLLKLRTEDSPHKGSVNEVLQMLKDSIRGAKMFPAGRDDQLEIAVHCYDEQAAGLVCVAALGDFVAGSRLWGRIIKPGRTIIGQAYRRREHLCWTPRLGRQFEEDRFWDYDERHTAIVSCPMFYPIEGTRRVAIVSLASRSNTSELIGLSDDEPARIALFAHVTAWYDRELLRALGVQELQV